MATEIEAKESLGVFRFVFVLSIDGYHIAHRSFTLRVQRTVPIIKSYDDHRCIFTVQEFRF